MTAFLQQYISPTLPVILWLFRGVTAGLAVWLLVRCCKSLFRGRDRESWGFVTLSNGARYELYHWENVIGRARRADIRVNFPSVSRTHAILQRDDGGTWRVDPINRSSGVLLNGKRTLVPANLNPGDSIALGGVELFFFPSEQPQHTGQPKKRPNPVGSLWLLTFIQLLLWGQFAPGFGAENIYPVSAGFFGLCGLGWALYGVSRRLHRRQFDLETLALLLATVGRRALEFLSGLIELPAGFIDLWSYLRFIVLGVVMFLMLTVLYMLALGRRCPLREVAPGVAVSLAAWMLLSLAFSYYVENLAHYTQLYGSIATIVVVLLWLYMSGTVLILGGELNAVVLHRRTQRRRAAEEKAAEKAARPTRQEAAAQKPSGATQPPRQPQPPKPAEQPGKADPPKPAEPPKQTQGQPPQEAIPPEKEQPERPGKEQSGS